MIQIHCSTEAFFLDYGVPGNTKANIFLKFDVYLGDILEEG